MTHDRFGPHVRNVFALKTLDAMMERPREEWDPAAAMGLVYWIFPGMSIAGGWRERTVISIILPGDSWGESMTWQATLLRTPPQTAEELLEAEKTAEWFFAAFRDEDYTAQQRGAGRAGVAGGQAHDHRPERDRGPARPRDRPPAAGRGAGAGASLGGDGVGQGLVVTISTN